LIVLTACDVRVIESDDNVANTNFFAAETFSSVNGQLNAKLALPPQGTCKMSTVNGQILLTIPKTTSAEFFASVTNGEINLANLSLNNSVSTPKSLRGRMGDGQGTITLSTVNGNISVSGF